MFKRKCCLKIDINTKSIFKLRCFYYLHHLFLESRSYSINHCWEYAFQVKANQLTNMNEIEFSIHGAGLDKKDFLGKSHPFLQICKKIGAKYITVHQTEVSLKPKKNFLKIIRELTFIKN